MIVETTTAEHGLRSELFTYDAQDCNSTENRDYSEIEAGAYTIGDTVAVPSGVLAHGVSMFVESRLRNGEPDVVSDDEVEGDYFHRNGNILYRATGRRVGVAGIFFPEEINYSVEYFCRNNNQTPSAIMFSMIEGFGTLYLDYFELSR